MGLACWPSRCWPARPRTASARRLNGEGQPENKPEQAPGFYLTIALATLVGVFFNFWHVDPVRALFWAAVLNGVIAAPMMAVIVHLATNRKVMGKFVIPLYLRVVGWIATLAMFAVLVGVFLARK